MLHSMWPSGLQTMACGPTRDQYTNPLVLLQTARSTSTLCILFYLSAYTTKVIGYNNASTANQPCSIRDSSSDTALKGKIEFMEQRDTKVGTPRGIWNKTEVVPGERLQNRSGTRGTPTFKEHLFLLFTQRYLSFRIFEQIAHFADTILFLPRGYYPLATWICQCIDKILSTSNEHYRNLNCMKISINMVVSGPPCCIFSCLLL